MPKIKTRKSITSRLRITKTGKVLRRQSFRRHLKANKSAKRLHNLKKIIEIKGSFARKIKKVMGQRNRAKPKNHI